MKKNKTIHQVAPEITKNDVKAVSSYLESGGWVTEHKLTRDFESIVANYVGRKYGTAVPNGTIAIYLALLSAGVSKGDKIAVPNLTMIATINAIIWTGAQPVLVDVDESLCMSYIKLKNITGLKGVIYVPLNGRTHNGMEISKWCRENKLLFIEDSAHALGSRYKNNNYCGNLGDLSIFSFTPHKIITTGQGGMVLCDKQSFNLKLQKLKTFNRKKDKQDWHEDFGLNFKITDMQSALGISQFQRLDSIIKKKRKIYDNYNSIDSSKFSLGRFLDHEVPWFFEIVAKKSSDIKGLYDKLKNNKIESRYFYPALSKQKYLKNISRTDLSYSEHIYSRVLWIPSSVHLTISEQEKVIDIINEY